MRDDIIQALYATFRNDPRALALWEAGSSAFDRADEMSDIDLQLLAKDGTVEVMREKAEEALATVGDVGHRYIVQQPSWHGHWQGFYRLEGAPPYLLVDLVIMEEKSKSLFTEPELHGQPRILFDRTGRVGKDQVDQADLKTKVAQRLTVIEESSEMFHVFIDKELLRGNTTDAFSFYESILVRPLVETLRMEHCPARYTFGLRYLKYDLPQGNAERIEELLYVKNPDELMAKKNMALAWLRTQCAKLRELGV